jgi:hypothetical protein
MESLEREDSLLIRNYEQTKQLSTVPKRLTELRQSELQICFVVQLLHSEGRLDIQQM